MKKEISPIDLAVDAQLKKRLWPIIFGTLLFFVALYFATKSGDDSIIQLVLYIFIVPPIAYAAYLQGKYRAQLVEDFAKSNNFTYKKLKPVGNLPFAIFLIGNKVKSLTNCFEGQILGNNFTFFNHQVNSQQNGRNNIKYYHGVIIDLPKKLPHIVIDARQSDSLELSRLFHKQHLMNLEGDFFKHFRVMAANSGKDEATSLLSPDVMVKLIDQKLHYDIEIVDGQLVIYR